MNKAMWSPNHARRRLSIGSTSSSLQFPSFSNTAPSISFEEEASFDEPDFSDSFHNEDDTFDEVLPFPEPQKKQRSPSATRTRRRSSLTGAGGHDHMRKERGRGEMVSPKAKSPLRQKKRISSDTFDPFALGKEHPKMTTSLELSPKLSPKRGGTGKKRIALKVRASDLSESKRMEIESLFRQLQNESPDSVKLTEKDSEKQRKRSNSVGKKRSHDPDRERGERSTSRSRRERTVDRSTVDGKRNDRSQSRQKKRSVEHKKSERKREDRSLSRQKKRLGEQRNIDRKDPKHHHDNDKSRRSRSTTRGSAKERERSRSRGSERKRTNARGVSPKTSPKPEQDHTETNFDTLKESLELLKSTLEASRF